MSKKKEKAKEYSFNIPSELFNTLENENDKILWKTETERAFEAGWDAAIGKACDAFCKFCGHYAIKTQGYTCRQDCGYYSAFKKAIMEEKK